MKFKNTYTLLSVLAVLVINFTFAQRGKHGALTISTPTTKVNEFTTLSADAAAGASTISVAASALNSNSRFTNTLQVGDLIMIYQTQGAIIKTFNTVGGQDSTYGQILNYNNAGNYEFAQVFAIPNSTSIVLDCGLANSYIAAAKTQIVRVPRYTSLTVNAGGELTTDAWNGTSGGVLAVEVDGSTTINGTVNATGLGFRGGAYVNNGNYGGARFVDVGGGANEGGLKGEGIGGSVTDYSLTYNGPYAMGAPANGGGGGDSHNAGGGGGANAGTVTAWCGYGVVNISYSVAYNLEFPNRANIVSPGGGRGGYSFSNQNFNPLVVPPGNTVTSWGGDGRRKVGGFGGRPLDYGTGRIYLGGGGGAGHVNQVTVSITSGGTGGNGGGLIFFQVYNNITGTGTIVSNGTNGAIATGPNPGPISSNVNGTDGCGGGGAGGTIILASTGNASGLVVNANGGKGGDQIIVKGGFALTNTEAEGTGGGGGGGYIAYSNTAPTTQNVLGALCGTTNASPMATFPPNGASNGADGLKDQNIKLYSLTVYGATVCNNSAASVTVTSNNATANFFWYNSLVGASQIGTGSVFTSSVFATPGVYTVWAQSCPGTYREPVTITVIGAPTVAATSASVCGTQTVTLTASGATTYTWSTSATTSTIAVSPTATTIYTVIGSLAGCTAQATSTVTSQNSPTLSGSATSTVLCANQTITLNTSGSAGTYSWSNGGGNTPSITVTTAGTYSAFLTNACGTAIYAVDITAGPVVGTTLSASANTVCAGTQVTLTASGTGTMAWSTGTVNTNSVVVTSPGIYTVTVSNMCGSATSSFQVILGPQPTVNVVPSATTFCTGQTATLTANGAGTYTWISPISAPVNGAVFTATAAGVYTVNGSTQCGNSSAQITVTFQVSPDISVVASKVAVCPGDTATLKATNLSGGGNFVWSTSSNTTNIETVLGGGTYTASYVNGCGVASATVIVIQSTLTPDFIPSATVGATPLSVTFTNTSFSYTLSQWNYGNGAALGNSQNGSAVYTTPGIYTITLVIQNLESCLASISKTIEVINIPFGIIPELLSPNSDGKNDVWEIKGIEQFTKCEVEIYNRWGNKVYAKAPYDNSFDGTANYKSVSGKLPTGTYFYILRLGDADNKVYNGYFQLVY